MDKLHIWPYSVYVGCLGEALRILFPELSIHPWAFDAVPNGYWDDLDNRRKYLEWLAERLHISKIEDWYSVRANDIRCQPGASLLLNYYGGHHLKAREYHYVPIDFSYQQALTMLYPDANWHLWLFEGIAKEYWEDSNARTKYFQWIEKRLHIGKHSDWYKVTPSDIYSNSGGTLIEYYNGKLSAGLAEFHPEIYWYPWIFDEMGPEYWEVWLMQKSHS